MGTKTRKALQLSSDEPLWWPRLDISNEQLRWWRAPRLPTKPDTGDRTILRGEPPSGFAWVRTESGYAPCILYEPESHLYEVEKTYRDAVSKRNPYLAPHGNFAGIQNGNNYHAVEFLRDFGALDKPPEEAGIGNCLIRDAGKVWDSRKLWVNLDDFWRRHRRYQAVVSLREAFGDRERLKAAWREIYAHLDDLNRIDPPMLKWELDHRFIAARWIQQGKDIPDHPEPFDRWLEGAEANDLKLLALEITTRELKNFAGSQVAWRYRVDGGRPAFRLITKQTSLWAAMWQFFARGTEAGVKWRICPHCGKLFSPSRKDRLYCTARIQELYSKRIWWEQNRGKMARLKRHGRSAR
jgi:hypothetical protein